jgi:hypothetical protein
MPIEPGTEQEVFTQGWWRDSDAAPSPTVRDTPEENLRELLANTTEFWAVTGTATAGSAEGFIGIPFDPALISGSGVAETDFRAAIGEDQEASVRLFGTGSVVSSGSIPLALIADIPAGVSEESAFTTFKQKCIAIIEDMHETSQAGEYLVLQDIETDEMPMRDRKSQGDGHGTDGPFVATYFVAWGLDSPI